MFAEQYKVIQGEGQVHEKSIADMVQINSVLLNARMDKLYEKINTNSNTLKDLSRNIKDLQESLTGNQNLIDN